MSKKSIIQHQGTVLSVEEGIVKVEITAQTACGACRAKSHCLIADAETKIIDISDDSRQYEKGDNVYVVLERTQGFHALILGYLIPFFCVVTALILSMAVFHNEVMAGLAAVGILAIYYCCLYMFRDKIKHSFRMKLTRQ